MRLRYITLSCLILFAQVGCGRGYASARDLESAERGPAQCGQSCHELGMRMAAFVLVQNNVSGCVCEPVERQAGERTGSTAAVAGGHVVIQAQQDQQRRQQQQQQTQQY